MFCSYDTYDTNVYGLCSKYTETVAFEEMTIMCKYTEKVVNSCSCFKPITFNKKKIIALIFLNTDCQNY